MNNGIRWRRLAAVALMGAALLAACGASGGDTAPSSPGTAPGSPSEPRTGSEDLSGWLAADDATVIYLDYRDQSGELMGTMQVSSLEAGDAGFEVKGSSNAFSGSLDGSDVSITVGSAAPWFGTLRGDELTLNLPQDDGALTPVVLRQASVADHNEAVANLRAQAQSMNDQEADAENEAALDEEGAKASDAFDRALAELGSAGQAAGEEGDGTLLGSYDSAMTDYEAAWQEMQRAESEMRSTDCIDVGFAADDVGFARDTVGFARDTLGFVDGDADAATERIDTAIADAESKFTAAVAAAGVADQTPPARGTLDTMIGNGREAQEVLASKRSSARARADEIDAAADALNADARAWADSRGC
jgi:hypothetical protein